MLNIGPVKKEATPWVKFFNKPNSWLPKDKYRDYYLTFVEKVVERYDGDGLDDMPGLASPIKYWQISNEPHYRANMRGLTKLIKVTQPVIKRTDPEAKVILGGASLQPLIDKYLKQLREYYYPILDELGGEYIDVFDFHWYGAADGDYRKIKVIYQDIRENLDLRGYKDTEIWVTEMGTYSGDPKDRIYDWLPQTEREQARDLLKRYIYSLSLGIRKVFWAWGMIEGFGSPNDNNFFDHTGLIYDGKKLSEQDEDRGRGMKKLAFYTYRLMTEKLEGVDWNNIQIIQEKNGIYIYKFTRVGHSTWVAWNDNVEEKEITISGVNSSRVKITEAIAQYESGSSVTDYRKAFRTEDILVSNRKVAAAIGQCPVFIEEQGILNLEKRYVRVKCNTKDLGIIAFLGTFLRVSVLIVEGVAIGAGTASYNAVGIPSEDDIFRHITTIVNQGIRRPGYPADVWVENYIEGQFKKYGLQEVRQEEVTHHGKDYGEKPEINLKWVPVKTSLTVYNEKESIAVPAFSIPYAASTDDRGLDLEIVELSSKRTNYAVKGKIALYPVKFREGISHWFYKRISEWYYDPEGTFVGKRQAPVFSVEGNEVMKYALNSRASGFIGVITNNAEPDMYEYHMPVDGTPRPIPGVYISEENGDEIRALMQQGATKAKLISKVTFESFVSHNIIGTLEGKSDDWIIIGSHHDAPFYGAVEDASGLSMVLAQAEYWSKAPQDERPHNMLFLVDAGHMSGVTGNWTFVRKHQEFLKKVVLEVHLEHIALEYTLRKGEFVPTGYRQALWWFTTRSNRLIEIVKSAIKTEGLDRSYIFRPDAIDRKKKLPTTDGAFFHRYRVPLVQIVSAPAYLFTSADTLEKVDKKGLVPITRAVIQIINGISE